ncbi:hypothetical protein [Burkholderia sp. RS02]|uniref:hypothetical protein n=1 Tax=unclassified Burkholderia TaxID=2613784 RepID=UPI0032187814
MMRSSPSSWRSVTAAGRMSRSANRSNGTPRTCASFSQYPINRDQFVFQPLRVYTWPAVLPNPSGRLRRPIML